MVDSVTDQPFGSCVVGTTYDCWNLACWADTRDLPKTAAGPLDHLLFLPRVNAIPRPIPKDVPWYGGPSGLNQFRWRVFAVVWSKHLYGSLLPYIWTILWNYKFYHVYGFLFGVCIYSIYLDHCCGHDEYHCCLLLLLENAKNF
jgi:hypothetical protein